MPIPFEALAALMRGRAHRNRRLSLVPSLSLPSRQWLAAFADASGRFLAPQPTKMRVKDHRGSFLRNQRRIEFGSSPPLKSGDGSIAFGELDLFVLSPKKFQAV